MKHVLPELDYSYEDLEPHIDAKTMELHHSKHHQTYVDKLNAALEKYPDLLDKSVEELLQNLDTLAVDEADRTAIKNHGGGHANHSLWWQIINPNNKPDASLSGEIIAEFGSVEEFKKQFTEAATKVFGSGWAWLVRNADGKLLIKGMPNQDSPIMLGLTPIFGIDVWEHAYYLKYQNRRPEYIEAFWKILKLI